jgi:hypothetical protein
MVKAVATRGRAAIRAILEQLAVIAGETVLFCRHLTEVRVQAGLGWGQ